MMKVTIAKFQGLQKILKSDLEDFDKGVAYVAELTDQTIDEVRKMKPKKFARACAHVAEVFSKIHGTDNAKPGKIIRANGQAYRFNFEPKEPPHNAGKYVEIAIFSRDPIANLNKLLASIVTPVRWGLFGWIPAKGKFTHERISLDLLEAEIVEAFNAYVFFCQISSASTRCSLPFSMMRMEENRESFSGILHSTSDGFIRRHWLPRWKE